MCYYRGSSRELQSFWVSLCHVDGVTVTGWLYHKEGDNRSFRYVCLSIIPTGSRINLQPIKDMGKLIKGVANVAIHYILVLLLS